MFAAKSHPILDIYAMLWHVVRAYPAVTDGAGVETEGLRPDTFAALADFDDIETDTLKKDARYADPNQHLFFSRQWSGFEPHRQQPESLRFHYPLQAVQPFTVEPKIKTPFNHLRITFVTMDQRPDKLTPTNLTGSYRHRRTFEQLEADLSRMHEATLREWLQNWAVYQVGEDLIWSPKVVAGAAVKWRMRDALTADNLAGKFYRDVGVDRVSGVQSYVDLKMPLLHCYAPSSGSRPAAFDYTPTVATPYRPSGLIGGNSHETPIK